MRITDIQERTASIASDLRNAVIDFSRMTVSVAALHTDVVINGRPAVGYGFNSNGRYAQGCLLRERFIPRIMSAAPAELLTDQQDNLDPIKIWHKMLTNEKPGGHGERCVAVGAIDMAVWDAVAKIARKPLYRLLAERHNRGKVQEQVLVYAAGGYYYPGKGLAELKAKMQSYLGRGYTVVKIKIGGSDLAHNLERIQTALALMCLPPSAGSPITRPLQTAWSNCRKARASALKTRRI